MCITLHHETRRARKVHRCTWCGQTIEPGQRYFHFSVIFEGELQTNKMHPECEDALQDAASDEPGGCYVFEPGEGERPAPRAAA